MGRAADLNASRPSRRQRRVTTGLRYSSAVKGGTPYFHARMKEPQEAHQVRGDIE